MTLHVQTAQLRYSGPDRIDISSKSLDHVGLLMAPSSATLSYGLRYVRRATSGRMLEQRWLEYARRYRGDMVLSRQWNRWAWDELLSRDRAVLVCYCTDAEHCHRRLLAGMLERLGAVYEGEVDSGS